MHHVPTYITISVPAESLPTIVHSHRAAFEAGRAMQQIANTLDAAGCYPVIHTHGEPGCPMGIEATDSDGGKHVWRVVRHYVQVA
jgi:hypothetical protein